MPILIRDEHFERRVDAERRERGHKSQSKTLQELAEERLFELHAGTFLPPAPAAEAESPDVPQSAAA